MRYSIEPKDRIYVKGYGFLSFAKNMGTHLSYKYSQKLLDTVKKSTSDAIKTASKRVIQKIAEAHSAELRSQNNEANGEIEIPKERYISPEKKITHY